MNKDFSSCASNKVFKICSFELNKDIDSIDESNCMAVVVQRLECTVVGVKRNVFVFEDGKFRETRVRLSPSALNLLEKGNFIYGNLLIEK